MLEVQDTSERTIIDWLEVSVPSHGRTMNMLFLEAMSGSVDLVSVSRIGDML